ncbi:Gfo/Idh/MocA family oxidoreductase [Variovorax dokdonensis]|uniref:Gfo/Idh/MocA family oxidoreductase n=1 Tax=Variovorax dokdonensis TaxID=344883 RepID=A0ABT7N5L4_9BURK|nr:Gfo/Idh/MocA family oxidoreductase [Variovorax dokdonensis]MDM0043231.1 Gfo/Idh/MocA family oxidoreductase [Variovorax dokdonensis]
MVDATWAGTPARAPMRVLIVGCGAVVEEYQGPSAMEAERMGLLKVVGLVDRSEERLARCSKLFPQARCFTDVETSCDADLALIATPARSHFPLASSLLRRGQHLLIEKPVCATTADVRALQAQADAASRVLAVGHFRRFFPALEAVRAMIANGTWGAVRRIVADEGGLFRWPAASAGFFTREEGGGGVTLDIGIHMLEILISWMGEPELLSYADDAMGGVEINSQARLRWKNGAEGHIRLSWDVALANRYRIEFEHATVTWRTGQATDLLLEIEGMPDPQLLSCRQRHGQGAEYALPTHGYLGAFTAQWADVAEAVASGRAPRVGTTTAGAALSLVEAMYAGRQLLDMPHLSDAQRQRAVELSGVN